MNSFEKFMDDVEQSVGKTLTSSEVTLPGIQSAITARVEGLLASSSIPADEQEKFLEQVSSLVRDQRFISEFGDQIGEPSIDESEDEFIKRGSDQLRQMLYRKLKIGTQTETQDSATV